MPGCWNCGAHKARVLARLRHRRDKISGTETWDDAYDTQIEDIIYLCESCSKEKEYFILLKRRSSD